jgi:hypothetical protein
MYLRIKSGLWFGVGERNRVLYNCMSDKGTETGVSYHSPLVLSQTVGMFLPTPITRFYVSYVKTTRIYSTAVLFKIMQVSSFEILPEL